MWQSGEKDPEHKGPWRILRARRGVAGQQHGAETAGGNVRDIEDKPPEGVRSSTFALRRSASLREDRKYSLRDRPGSDLETL